LGNSRETSILNLLGIELKRVGREFETLLNQRREFTDTAAFLSKDLLGVSCPDDNLL